MGGSFNYWPYKDATQKSSAKVQFTFFPLAAAVEVEFERGHVIGIA